MSNIPIARGAYLIPFLEYLTEIESPVFHLLALAHLPAVLERDDYFAVKPALHFLTLAADTERIQDFGFQVARRMRLGDLSPRVLRALDGCPTLYGRLKKFSQLASWECTHAQVWMSWHGTNLRVNSSLKGGFGLTHPEHLQWLQNMTVIQIVRQFAGPTWCPATIAFQARFRPSREAHAFFPGVRFLTGEKTCWIDIPDQYRTLHHPIHTNPVPAARDEAAETVFAPDFIKTLRLLLRPYINDGYPKIDMLSEIIGLSVRTLQCRLDDCGTTYSELVQHVRHSIAKKLLSESRLSITEIADTVRYSDHSHFTRAFRRLSGISPQRFRIQRATAAPTAAA